MRQIWPKSVFYCIFSLARSWSMVSYQAALFGVWALAAKPLAAKQLAATF